MGKEQGSLCFTSLREGEGGSAHLPSHPAASPCFWERFSTRGMARPAGRWCSRVLLDGTCKERGVCPPGSPSPVTAGPAFPLPGDFIECHHRG